MYNLQVGNQIAPEFGTNIYDNVEKSVQYAPFEHSH